jgi:LysR family transcriptional regulator, glycine cleavage system transcriptional activator
MARPQRLPPIQLLLAFEAAGRNASFKAAAKELHVTPSAISQQLRTLEDCLGFALFERGPRAVTLTEAGALYLQVARGTLDTFRHGTELLLDRYRHRVLRVNTDASVAHEVLIPNLSTFERAHPDIDLRIETSSALIDLRSDAADVALRYGDGPWDGVSSVAIGSMIATPVAAPGLLRQRPVRSIEDLAAHTLLAVQGAPRHWDAVAAEVGFKIGRRKSFDSYLATLQAAAHGLGVALALFPISTAWVQDGRLMAPLAIRLPAADYHLVYRPGDETRSDIIALKTWVTRCFAALPALGAGGR